TFVRAAGFLCHVGGEKKFASDEVAAILRRAIEKQSAAGDMTRADLEQTAREMGVTPETLEESILEEHIETEVRKKLAQKREERQKGATIALAMVAGVAIVIGLSLAIAGAGLWALFPAAILAMVALPLALVMRAGDDPAEAERLRTKLLEQVRRE